MARVRAAEEKAVPGETTLTETVARQAFRLMAYKDEYEVARLYTDGSFERQLHATFDGADLSRVKFHLAPPLFGRKDAAGNPVKTTFGPWMMGAFRLLAKLRFVRGTVFDLFGRSEERQTERRLASDYEGLAGELADGIKRENHALAVALAAIPEKIRGFGHVKAKNHKVAMREEAELLRQWRADENEPHWAARAAE